MDSRDQIADIFESTPVKTTVVVLGAAAALAKLFQLALPKYIQVVATFLLVFAVAYIVWIFLRTFHSRGRGATPEDVYQYMANRYGVGYRLLKIEFTVNEDGSGQLRREVHVEAYSELAELDTFLIIRESPPPDRTWDMEFGGVRSLTQDRDVYLKLEHPNDGKLSGLVSFAPQLDPGQEVTYEMIEKTPSGLYAVNLNKEELKHRQTPYDYVDWTINRPTRRLLLTVYFPHGIKPKGYRVDVRRATPAPGIPSAETLYEERRRLEKLPLQGPSEGRFSLVLDVDCPMVGLMYMLRWDPLQRSQ